MPWSVRRGLQRIFHEGKEMASLSVDLELVLRRLSRSKRRSWALSMEPFDTGAEMNNVSLHAGHGLHHLCHVQVQHLELLGQIRSVSRGPRRDVSHRRVAVPRGRAVGPAPAVQTQFVPQVAPGAVAPSRLQRCAGLGRHTIDEVFWKKAPSERRSAGG